MTRTFLRQDAQIRESVTFNSAVTVGSTMQSGANHIEDDLNAIRSQLAYVIDNAANWYDDLATVNSKKRSIKDLNTDLDTIEIKKLLFRTQVLADISVPASVAASGLLTFGSNPSDTQTVTIDEKVYTFQSSLTEADGNVKIGALAGDSLDNLTYAINLSGGTAGVDYASAMTLHPTVSAADGGGDTMTVTAKAAGTAANLIATTDTVTGTPNFGATTLTSGAGDVVVLGAGEIPSVVAAVGAATTEGAIVVYNSDFGVIALDEVSGPSAIRPDNLCMVRDGTSGDSLFTSGGKMIYALLQSEIVTNGHTINDSDQQVQLSFVIENATADDLIVCPVADIAGTSLNYSYVRRLEFGNIPEEAFLSGVFVDQTASVDVTLDNCIDNQSGAATQATDIDIDIADTKAWGFRDANGDDLLHVYSDANGSISEITIGQDVDVYDNDAVDVDFKSGAAFGSGGTEISINEVGTEGHIMRAGDLMFDASAGEIYFDDVNHPAGWGGTEGVKFSENEAEWTAFEAAFGSEVTLLGAIATSANKAARTKKTVVLTEDIAADTDLSSSNCSAALLDYSGVGTFVDDVDIYLNGVLMINGVDLDADNDCYPGTTPASGHIKFEYALEGTSEPYDQVTMIIWGS